MAPFIPFLHIGIVQAAFGILFFLSRRPFKIKDAIAAIFLFFLAFPMLIKISVLRLAPISFPDIILFSLISYPLTYGPLLYLYTRFEIDPLHTFKKKYLVHFVPFILILILPIIIPQFELNKPAMIFQKSDIITGKIKYPIQPQDYQEIPELPPYVFIPFTGTEKQDNISYEQPKLSIMMYFTLILIVISFITYTIWTFLLLQKHRKNISEYFSYESTRLNLRWLKLIAICFGISYIFIFITMQTNLKLYYFHFDPRVSPDAALTFLIFTFSFFAIKQPLIFGDIDKAEIKDHREKEKIKKYEKSGLKTTELETYLNILEQFMKNEKPYLESDLTLLHLSEKLNIPKHYLTQVINEKLNKNFYLYINEYRINEARHKMTEEKFKDYTILRIAYESGFNSKSVFNKVFKEVTGLTPTEHKRKFH